MKSSALILPVFMVCATAAAQVTVSSEAIGPGRNGNQPATAVVILPQACPVNLQARQSGVTDMVKVKDGDQKQPEALPGPRQRIRLLIGGTGAVRVAGATVTARGLSARARISQADGSRSSDVRRTVDLKFSANQDGTVWADVILPGFTAVNSIKLESIVYADGTTRDVSGKGFCRVVPDPVMLVAGR